MATRRRTNQPTPGTTTTTTVPQSPDMEGPQAAERQLFALRNAKYNSRTRRFDAPPYGSYTQAELDSTVKALVSVIGGEASAAPQAVDMEGPQAAERQLFALRNAKLNSRTKKYDVPPYGSYTKAELDATIKSLVSVIGGEASQVVPRVEPTDTTTAQSTRTRTTRTNRTNRATPPAAETVVVDGRRVKVGGERWKEIIQQEFGSLWDIYNSNTDVKKVVDKSVKEGWFNDEAKLTGALTNTSWFRTTQQSARQFAIKMSSDPAELENQITREAESLRASTTATGITFDDATLRKLATDKIKFGWSPQQVVNAVGSEAVALAQLGGAQGIADLRQGVVARQLREKAAAYAQKPSESQIDTWTREIMTGKKSETQWEDLMRDSARTQFRSLQPALDKGQDVETALAAYKQQAVSVLGSAIDASNIDWTSDKWNKALNYRDEKTNEYRQMDIWEWNRYLRTLPEWQNTDEAKDAYRNVAFALAQGFGKMA